MNYNKHSYEELANQPFNSFSRQYKDCPKPAVKTRSKSQRYLKVERPVRTGGYEMQNIVNKTIESSLISPFKEDKFRQSILTRNRAKSIFDIIYTEFNSQKRSVQRFNGIIDKYVEVINEANPNVDAKISDVMVRLSNNEGKDNYVIGGRLDDSAHKILSEEHTGLIQNLAPNRPGFHHTAKFNTSPCIGLATCRDEFAALEFAEQLKSSGIIGLQVTLGNARSTKV